MAPVCLSSPPGLWSTDPFSCSTLNSRPECIIARSIQKNLDEFIQYIIMKTLDLSQVWGF